MGIKYRMIAETLEKEISDGVFSNTKKLPTEDVLMKKYEVSRNTIRKAVDLLVTKGFVYRVQGSGVFTRDSVGAKFVNLQNMGGLTNDFNNRKIETKVIDFKQIKANEDIADKLKCEVGTDVYFVNRLRYIDDCEHSVEYSYFNKDVILYLNEEIIRKSIYKYIRNDLKLTIGVIDRIIYAGYLDDNDAKLLNLEKNGPALYNENIARLTTGEIFDYSTSVLNYKNVKYTILSNLK